MYAFKLRFFREQRGISQRNLALSARVDESNIQHLELGKNTNPTLETMIRLAVALETTPAELFFPDFPTPPCPPEK